MKLDSNLTLLAQIASVDIFIYSKNNVESTVSEKVSDLKRFITEALSSKIKVNELLIINKNNFYITSFMIQDTKILIVPHLNTVNVAFDTTNLIGFGQKISETASLIYQLLTQSPAPTWNYRFKNIYAPQTLNFFSKQQIEKLVCNEQEILIAISELNETKFKRALKRPTYSSYMGAIFEKNNYERGMKDVLIHFITLLFYVCLQKNELAINLALKVQDNLLEKIEFRTSFKPFASTLHQLAMECFVTLKNVRHITNLPLAEKCVLYIKSNIYKKISLVDVAQYVGYSPSTVSHTFKKEFKVSIRTYINSQKITTAKHMLATKVLRPSEISNLLSFSNPSYFNHVFKKEVGVTPSVYRKQIIQANRLQHVK
ncbi:MAG: AraC family transcriptional regulator [Liquorilactobacillus ghanensis]